MIESSANAPNEYNSQFAIPALDEFEDKNIVKTTACDFLKIEDEKPNVITELFTKLCTQSISIHEKLESVYAIENFMRGLKHW